ncbi:beta-ketoacyl synthase N-terminal-like domain-containing protein, partial [Escherichia coli]|uniref:beta-ketoacyl synthase N-terminal-like domain-containing protein n=1 Tax=Escherichia coli TaxID=562 RepID=UPI0035D02680
MVAGGVPSSVAGHRVGSLGPVWDTAAGWEAHWVGLSRQEAGSMDPQQRLFLQAVWHALEHAGY